MDRTTREMERAKEKLGTLTGRLGGLNARLTAVSRTAGQAAKAIARAGKETQAVLALLSFDEINRLKEKSAGAARGSSGGGAGTQQGKVKTGPTETYDFALKFARPPKELALEFWTQFRLGLQEGDNGGGAAGQSLVERIAQGIGAAFGDPGAWVTGHLWTPIQSAWAGLGGVAVSVGAKLSNTAGELWSGFLTAWQSGGSRAVSILNTLQNGAGTLWQRFQSGWGSRGVSIVNTLSNGASALWQGFQNAWGSRGVSVVNTLKNSASALWEQFRSGWAGRMLGLTVSFNANVSGVKRAVYKALGLSGWPSISFAARGGVFRSPTLTMLGEAGSEAVVPLENNTGWMDLMAEKLGERMGSGGSLTVPVYIGGEKLGEAVVEAINAATRRTGVSPIYI